MPVLRSAVTEGRLGWTKAQEVARVVTPATESAWVERAVELPREELRRQTKAARGRARERRQSAAAQLAMPEVAAPAAPPAADPPTTIAVQLDGLRLARFDALIASAKKSGAVAANATRAEVILAGLAALTENTQRVRRRAPAATVIVQRCPDCEAAFAVTNQGSKRLSEAVSAAIRCDHVSRDERGHNRSAIPPAVRRQVLDRDGHRCATPGCSNAQFLEVHHVVPRTLGGSNRAENLTTLCSRCHRHAHKP
jgi:5-methylcytosine-specific restriction endonuclease McrA